MSTPGPGAQPRHTTSMHPGGGAAATGGPTQPAPGGSMHPGGGAATSRGSAPSPQAPAAARSAPAASGAIGEKALESLKRLGRIALGITPAIAIAGGMLANEPGMARAVAVWDAGMASRLDDGIKQLLPQILNTARSGWIARDREEFERVIAVFHREVGSLRSVLSRGSGMLDEVAAAYRGFWTWVIKMSLAAISLVLVAKRLQQLPNTSVLGVMLEKYLTAQVNIATLFIATSLATTLREGGDVLTTMVKKGHQFGFVAPGGDAAIDFRTITIDASQFPSFAEPPTNGGLPPGYQNFDWVEPKRESQPAS
ncbi:hypothetical protein [Nonomuraea sp. SBT364]|uniref:hypothetical protein n=1 Tax=Nonomuraea sp. SBT364 TaxID=1580530 RepID=UPI00066C11DA|nr:hypothetical protein [Nonomuraea sp. SBT364]